MVRVYAEKEGVLLYIVIHTQGSIKRYEAGIYEERLKAVFGDNFEQNKKYRCLKSKNTCDTYSSGLGWYLLKIFLGLTRMKKIDVIKFASDETKNTL